MTENVQLIVGIELALSSPQIPNSLTVTILNLAEFMEMLDKPLPLDIVLLAHKAASVDTFSKCLHYREIEFNSKHIPPSSACIEALISVNNTLGLHEAASGTLQYVMMHYPNILVQPLWLEKLSRWDEARLAYLQQIASCKDTYPNDIPPRHRDWMSNELGVLRCLHALGEYEELAEGAMILRDHLKSLDNIEHSSYRSWTSEVERLGANAAWMLGRWDSMEDFMETESIHHQNDTDVSLDQNISFYQAVLAIHKQDYGKSRDIINTVRDSLADALSSLLSENYSRANRAMVTMQVSFNICY